MLQQDVDDPGIDRLKEHVVFYFVHVIVEFSVIKNKNVGKKTIYFHNQESFFKHFRVRFDGLHAHRQSLDRA